MATSARRTRRLLPRAPGANGQERQVFGSEDLAAFVRYAKETVGIADAALLAQVFLKFVEDVGSVRSASNLAGGLREVNSIAASAHNPAR